MRRNENLVAAYLGRLREEAQELYQRFPGPLRTIYIGGGTPSHLSDAELAQVVDSLRATWGQASQETTLEADPLTFDTERLQHFKDLGFKRLSLGLQSTQDQVLGFLGRAHSGKEGLEALELALASGLQVSADIITGIRGQDTALDLHRVAATGVDHISVYSLTIEPFTPFARRSIQEDEHKAADDFELTQRVLADYGLERYEVSSHARPGYESQHNQVYWQGGYFLNLGPSAAGFIPSADSSLLGVRHINPPIKDWLNAAAGERIAVTAEDYLLDCLMTGLRTRQGVDLTRLKARTGIAIEERYASVLAELQQQGLLGRSEQRLWATAAGITQLNGVVRRFFHHST